MSTTRCLAFLCLVGFCHAKTALVLAGGGAKGAVSVGALQELCKTDRANTWDMVLGTSIGSFSAGILAQFSKDKQCSDGLNALVTFWQSVESIDDLMQSTSRWPKTCLSGLNALSIAKSWLKSGGMCDPLPGYTKYHEHVLGWKIQQSGMELWVPASNLNNTIEATWFTNGYHDIVNALLASGGLSPLLPPVELDGEYYVDGGLFHNTPISKALKQGATKVIALMLTPIENNNIGTIPDLSVEPKPGPAIISYYSTVVQRLLLVEKELNEACFDQPQDILGYYPDEMPFGTTDFEAEKISQMMELGRSGFRTKGLIDLCQMMRKREEQQEQYNKKSSSSSDGSISSSSAGKTAVIFVVGAIAGCIGTAIGMFLIFRRRVVDDNELKQRMVVQP